jgi:hypothetical protein
MPRKKHTTEQIITKLRQAEIMFSDGKMLMKLQKHSA